MAEIILTNVLNKKIPIDELFKWLTADNPEETISPDIVQSGTTRTDFISYFLNYLREQCKSILPELKEIQEKPVKKTIPIEITSTPIGSGKRIWAGDSPVACPYINKQDYSNDYKTRHGGQAGYQAPALSTIPLFSPPSHGLSVACLGPRLPGASNPRSPMPSGNFPPLPHQQLNAGSPLPNNAIYRYSPPNVVQPNFHPANPHFQANCQPPTGPHFSPNQTSGNWNHGNITKYSAQTTNPRQYNNNLIDENCPTGVSSPYNGTSANVAGFNQAQMQMTNLNLSSLSGTFDTSLTSVSLDASSPRRKENSKKNDSSIVNSSLASFSPLSPLYANSTSIIFPRRAERSHNETQNSHDVSCNSPNISRTSTPKSANTGSGQKIAKPGQNQNLCLGDFIKSDGKGSGKISRKQLRTQLWKQSQAGKKIPGETKPEKVEITCKTESKTSETKSKRRIKPTRLNVSSDKETRGTEVFGVISRPTTANPKFVEAPSTDKIQDESSFDIERGLLKLERQRKPKNEAATIEAISNEPKLPTKIKPESTIVPRLDLVENAEILDTLASLYSGILDRNLMSNPMTELYFLMTLLTTQYKVTTGKKIVEKKMTADAKELSASSSSVQILETLKDDLGCAELSDEIATDTNDDDSTNDERSMRKKSFNENTRESSNAEDSRDELDEDSIDEDKKYFMKYFDTAHNCVYFATVVMLNQQYLLRILDRATLKLLCENQHISTFQPELQKYLNDIYSVKCLQTNRVKQMDSGNSQTNVCFQVDTDNRETFPSSVAFSLFRKQRDLFYDILKDWEDNHLKPDWSYQRALKNKINALLALHTDAVNYCHFAKLFISQLLVSSGQSGKTEDPMNDESLSILKSLKDLNPEKLLQLKGRLVTPLTSTGPVPQPIFPGVQEFYKEFILNACNWKFYVILENTLIREIMELNEAQFARSEIEGTETTVDESTKQSFIACVSSLRLLAKFMSFTLSLPFRSAANSPEWLLSQIQLRGRVLPSLDLQSCLLDALTNRRLSLTVPWIVQYMAMLDSVTLRLPYYVNVGELLYCIYRISNHCNPLDNDDSSISPETSMLMIFTIGWLFELTNFPRDLYAHWQMNYNDKKLRMIDRSNDSRQKYRNMIDKNEKTSKEFVKYNSTLDELEIIDDRALYECCPFLTEFKILLISGNATLANGNANRHITPVSSQLSQPSFVVKTKNLQMQLEDAFFHGQPSSIRKTVDFVSERVASSCVKYICNTIIPLLKQRDMKDYIKSKNGKIELIPKDEDPEEKTEASPSKSPTKAERKAQTELAERQMQALAITIKKDVKRECIKIMPVMCETRTIKSIESLLSEDAVPSVKETCIAIAIRTANERIEQWIDAHIVETLFLKNMNFELKRLLKEGYGDQPDKEICHNTKVPCPTEVIGMIRNSMWELLEKKSRWTQLSVDSVVNTLKCLHQTLTERADLVEYPEKNLYTMSVEYCLLLITHRQDLFTSEIQETFLNIWKMNKPRVVESESLFARIISPRNIRLLTSTSDSSVMKVFGRLLKGLLRHDLLTIEALTEQCVALFRQEWPEPILKQLPQCLKDVVTDYKCSGVNAEGTKYLLGWIATMCDEMATYD